MTKMKRVLCLVLALAIALAATGCGGAASSGSAAAASAAPAESGSKAAAVDTSNAEVTMKLAHDHMVGSPFQKSAEHMKELIETNSNGRIKVEIYPAQQLGSAREMIEGMQMGTIEAVLVPTAKFGGFDQRLNLCDMPFLFPNEDILWQVLEGEVGQEAMAGLQDIGILGVQYWAEGFKYITANKEIRTLDDMRGMKMRTMEAPIIMSMFSAWGANPVPIDFSEVYNSLQQKVVDGQENPIISIHDMKFYEVQSYMMQMDHAYLSYFLSYSKMWYDGLDADLQKVVMDAGLESAQYHKSLMAETNAAYLENIENFGNTTLVVLSDEEKQAWIDAVQPLYAEYRDMIGGELLDKAVEQVKSLQG